MAASAYGWIARLPHMGTAKETLLTMAKYTFQITLTPQQYTNLVAKLAAQGIAAGTSGTLPSHDGVTLSYVVAADNVATFTVDQKPFLVPDSLIESEVSKYIASL